MGVSFTGSADILGAAPLRPVLLPPWAVSLLWLGAMVDGEEKTALWVLVFGYVNDTTSMEWKSWGICYIGPSASVRFHIVSRIACFQASDWLPRMANRSTGVSRMRAARVVASLRYVVTLHAHGPWTSLLMMRATAHDLGWWGLDGDEVLVSAVLNADTCPNDKQGPLSACICYCRSSGS